MATERDADRRRVEGDDCVEMEDEEIVVNMVVVVVMGGRGCSMESSALKAWQQQE